VAKKRYDYLERIEPKYCGWDPLPRRMMRKRILRKLVREAAMMGHGEIDNLGTLDEQRKQADRIAKELVP
jgi:hypothetical protein